MAAQEEKWRSAAIQAATPLNVEMASPLPFSGTLQSKGVRRSYAPRRSVGVGLVVVLVVVALAAGFLLGWATATAMR